MRSTFDPFAGPTQLIFAFEAVVIGGLGSLWGTLAGGIVLGVAQTIGAQIDPQYSVLAGHLVFLAVLASPRGGIFRARAARHDGQAARPPLDASSRRGSRGSFRPVRGRARLRPGAAVGRTRPQKLTTLLILVLLAAMWNALAGYGGLVSVGQQAFIGLGAYGTVWLVNHGVNPYLAMVVATLFCGAISLPVSFLVLRFRGAQFAIGMWVVAEVAAILVSFDQSLGAGTGTSLIELNYYSPGARQEYTYWLTLGMTAFFLGGAVRAAAQPARRLAAGDPRRRGRGGVGRRARGRGQADPVRARRGRLRRRRAR